MSDRLPGRPILFRGSLTSYGTAIFGNAMTVALKLIVGVAAHSIAEHYQPDFHAQAERLGATLQINDC